MTTTAVGATDITAAYLGTTALDKIYVGTTQVWPTGTPVTPVTFRSISALATGYSGGPSGDPLIVDKPAGTAVDDLLLIYCHSDDNQTMACTGFTAVGVGTYTGYSSATRRGHWLWKIAGSSEPSTYTLTGGGVTFSEALCFAYTGGGGIGVTGSTNGNFNSPALTVANNGSMEVVALTFDNSSSNAAAPAGWTRRLNGAGSYGSWAAERSANAGTTTSSNFTGTGDTTFGFGLFNIILTPVTVVLTVPGAPTLTVASPGNTTVDLTWTIPSSDGGSAITGYLVEKSANGTTGWSTVTTTGVVLTYTVTSLTNGTIQYFRVSSINSIGTGTPSNVLSATPVAPSLDNPLPPRWDYRSSITRR